MSEWVSDCCLTPAISWGEQVNFQWYDEEVRFVLDQHAELDFYSASSLKQQSAGRHVAQLGHTLSLFWANQSLLFLINAECLAEKQQNFIVFGSTHDLLSSRQAR